LKFESEEHSNDYKELLPQIIERIFSVCRSDPNFHLKDEMDIIENKSEALLQKIKNQDNLLLKSQELKQDLKQRIEIIENQNNKKQIELLELLGSDL
jgi:hypothetical protein